MHGALDGKLTEIQRQFGEDLKRFTVGDVVRDLYRNIEGEKKIS